MARESPRRMVVKLSGSLFRLDSLAASIKPFIRLFSESAGRGVQPILVTGGGEVARRYISAARSSGAGEATLDEIGIMVTRLHASLLASCLGEAAYPIVPTNLSEVVAAAESGKIVVAGGLHPGQSTNAVAALIAEKVNADFLINATDVDGVYTSDPAKDKGAEKLKEVTVQRLIEMLSEGSMGAGGYELMDLVALKIIERSRVPTRVVKCSVEALKSAVEGRDVGTLIVTERG